MALSAGPRITFRTQLHSWTPNRLYNLSVPLRLTGRRRRRLNQPWTAGFARRISIQARTFPTDGFTALPKHERFEEERLVGYKAEKFYPVRLGDVFKSRYQVVAKLGFGAYSTVWLCRDLDEDVLCTLKVCVVGRGDVPELAVSHHIKSIDTHHPGKGRVRVSLDDFRISSPRGSHQCLVFPTLGWTLSDLRDLFAERALEKTLLQKYMYVVVTGLDLLHQAGVVHTDLSPNNIMTGTNDIAVSKVEQAELDEPSPRKVLEDRTIHLSYSMPTTYDAPFIIDFGAARLGEPGQKHSGDVMPAQYRAPEIIAGMEWDSKIDIWSVVVTIWSLFERANLFSAVRDGRLDDELHFAEMVSLMGPPPKEFLQRSDKCRQYWNAEGDWIAQTPIPDQTLESRETRLEGEDRELLLALARKVLRWLPEERPSAEDLYGDGFLTQFMSEHRPVDS
ncbi:protein kinase [Pseudovirgaria hyperparasitica]|uniref:Protein kinase n=1 Tax=Pseudovirgaria hyperparasitica TaxID=470096 RepID=A0A6A6WHK9_9PEZI|nr:protein kinase [Pseudovirgaria hyperparasitica]KAF2762278.1 protein kinase [Pseudovirgaria hyperparasitica]